MRASTRVPAQNMLKAFQHINIQPERAMPVIAWNTIETPRLITRSATVLTRSFDFLANNTCLLKEPIIVGALHIMVNETARLLTSSSSTEEKAMIFYPKTLEKRLIPFARSYLSSNNISYNLKIRISNPNEPFIRFYEGPPFSTDYFGLQYHSNVVESALDPSIIKFDENMSEYVVHFAQHIVNDLVRALYTTYPPNDDAYNKQLEVVKLIFSKTALSDRDAENLLTRTLNFALYGSEYSIEIESKIDRLQKDKDVVSKCLKMISSDIRRHGREYGYAFTRAFVPNHDDFTINTSFSQIILNRVNSDRGKQ